MYTCPVCGYDRLEEPPVNFTICPCCGTEFSYNDARTSHADLRHQWIMEGARWWDTYTRPPAYWNPIQQLRNIGYLVTDQDLLTFAPQSLVSVTSVGLGPDVQVSLRNRASAFNFVVNALARMDSVAASVSLGRFQAI